MIAFFGPYVLYVSPVTMGFTAVNRYVRICKSNQQYKRLFTLRRSCISLASAWILIACYILITRFTGLQGFYFEPGYAVCLNQHFNSLATIIHYVFVFGLFFILPTVLTIFSYKKVFVKIREHNAVSARSLENQEGNHPWQHTRFVLADRYVLLLLLSCCVGHPFGSLPFWHALASSTPCHEIFSCYAPSSWTCLTPSTLSSTQVWILCSLILIALIKFGVLSELV